MEYPVRKVCFFNLFFRFSEGIYDSLMDIPRENKSEDESRRDKYFIIHFVYFCLVSSVEFSMMVVTYFIVILFQT